MKLIKRNGSETVFTRSKIAAAVAKALAAKEKADADAQPEQAKKPGRPAKETKE